MRFRHLFELEGCAGFQNLSELPFNLCLCPSVLMSGSVWVCLSVSSFLPCFVYPPLSVSACMPTYQPACPSTPPSLPPPSFTLSVRTGTRAPTVTHICDTHITYSCTHVTHITYRTSPSAGTLARSRARTCFRADCHLRSLLITLSCQPTLYQLILAHSLPTHTSPLSTNSY